MARPLQENPAKEELTKDRPDVDRADSIRHYKITTSPSAAIPGPPSSLASFDDDDENDDNDGALVLVVIVLPL
jgi:hypothetical protein